TKVQNGGGRLVSNMGNNKYLINMTKEEAQTMSEWPEVNNVALHVLPEKLNEFDRAGFTFSSNFVNHDNIPPIVIPFKGQQVTLTPENWPIYKTIITRYERNSAERQGDTFTINGEQTNAY